jgi:hypothetical protein
MKTAARALTLLSGTCLVLVTSAVSAAAQTPVHPTNTPVENRSPLGPLFGPISFAVLFALGAGLLVLIIVLLYMRYAPRFARDEGSAKVVRADRVLPGREAPRRAVDLSQAVPVVVQPPAVPALAAAAAAPAAPAAPAAAPAAAAPAPTAPPAQQAAAPAPAAEAPAAEAPAAEAPAPAAAPPAAPTPPPAPAEHVEVTMDQEAYEAALAELLAAGTDGRIAEGKARRAGMIAAKKKAAGGG